MSLFKTIGRAAKTAAIGSVAASVGLPGVAGIGRAGTGGISSAAKNKTAPVPSGQGIRWGWVLVIGGVILFFLWRPLRSLLRG